MPTILIIEDEKRVADLLKAGLEENGFQTIVAYDGAMGLRLFRAGGVQLVISDIILKGDNQRSTFHIQGQGQSSAFHQAHLYNSIRCNR